MRFHVLGVGSIGTLVSHHLRHTTLSPISLIFRRAANITNKLDEDLDRPPYSLSVQRGRASSTSTGFDIEKLHDASAPLHVETATTSGPPNAGIDSLIVCLKTIDTLPALKTLSPRLSSSSVITLLQNGMGVYDQLCLSVFPDPATRPHFILGTTTHGVTRYGIHGPVRHVSPPGQGEIKFGVVPDPRREVDINEWLWPGMNASGAYIVNPPPSPPLPLPLPPIGSYINLHTTLNTLLSMSDLSPSLLPMPNLHHQLLLKVAINSAINPLTSILGLGALPNGALISSEPGFRLIRQVLAETSHILIAYIRSLSEPLAPAPDVMGLFSPGSLEKRTLAVIRQTSSNTSSMAADISRGKLTEIDSINGYLIQLASRLNVPAPTHRMLVEMTKYVAIMSNAPNDTVEDYRAAVGRVRDRIGSSGAQAREVSDQRKPAEEITEVENVELRRKELEVRDLEARERILLARAIRRDNNKDKRARWQNHRRQGTDFRLVAKREASALENDQT